MIPTFAAGSRLGPYKIVSTVGTGGMGEVYRAHDDRLNRDVAVKILPADVAGDAERLERFEREARAAAALNHPNIVSIYDIGRLRPEGATASQGRAEDVTYVVMELLEGVTLRDELVARPPTARKATEWTVEIARGLAAAHAKGIVHRDIKPENLFVCADGRVKILDFGIARVTADERNPTDMATMAAGTEPGKVLGTAGYMSPEQVRGQPVDARSDIFSLGAVMFEMLAGVRAFGGDTSVEAMHAVLKNDPPELAATAPGVPPALDRVVRRCLEKRPEDRFYSAHDLAFALEAIGGSRTDIVAEVPAGRRSGRWLLAAVAVLLMAATAAVTWWLASRETGPSPPSIRQITVRRGTIDLARFTPAGDAVVYSARFAGGAPAPFETRLNSPESRQVGPANALLFAASDGGFALGLRPILSSGTYVGTLATQTPGGIAAREVANRILGADFVAGGLAAVESDGNGRRVQFPIGKVVFESRSGIRSLRAAPGGRSVAFAHQNDIIVIDADGARRTINARADALAWSPDGARLWFSRQTAPGQTSISSIAAEGGTPREEWRALGGLILEDISRDGRVLVRRDEFQGGTSVVKGDSLEPVDLSWLDRSEAVAISPAANAVLLNDAGGMYLRTLDGAPAVSLGGGAGRALTADGRHALREKGADRFEIVPVGAGASRELLHPGIESHFAWFHPDGARLVFGGRVPGGMWRHFVMKLDGTGSPTPVGPDNFEHYVGQEPISNDGRWLLGFPLPERTLTVHALDGTESIPVRGALPDDIALRFAEGDREIFVFNRDGLPTRVYRLDFRTGQRRLWREFRPGDAAGIAGISSIAMTPDGRIMAFNYWRVLSTLYEIRWPEPAR